MKESDGTFTRIIKNLEFKNWGRTVQNRPEVAWPNPNPNPNPNPHPHHSPFTTPHRHRSPLTAHLSPFTLTLILTL